MNGLRTHGFHGLGNRGVAPPIGEMFVLLVGHEIPVLMEGYAGFEVWQGADIRNVGMLCKIGFENFMGSRWVGFR